VEAEFRLLGVPEVGDRVGDLGHRRGHPGAAAVRERLWTGEPPRPTGGL